MKSMLLVIGFIVILTVLLFLGSLLNILDGVSYFGECCSLGNILHI